MPKKKPLEGKPEVHKDLDGFEMNINEFGEITTNTNIDKLNKFLNDKVDDKKFKGLDGLPYAKLDDDDDDDDDAKAEEDDLTEIADEFEEFRQFNDKDFKDEFDFDDKDEKGDFDDDDTAKHIYEDLEDDDDPKKLDDDDDDDFDEEEFLDDMADDFSEEDNYNFDEGDFDDKY